MINNFAFEDVVLTPLTKREIEILILLSQGYSNNEISEKLFISESTADTHVGNLYQKLNTNWINKDKDQTKRIRTGIIWQRFKKEIIEQARRMGNLYE
jgi:DNA-binding NarL/FixJ family response regulator